MSETVSEKVRSLRGTCQVAADKSVSHRALMFGAVADGETEISNLLESEDVLNTANALRRLGAKIDNSGGVWTVAGVPAFHSPDAALDMGNSGTGARLLAGLIAGQDIAATLTGDASLRSRPMNRIAAPLSKMGARIETTDGKLPMTVTGVVADKPFTYTLPVASAQLKSAVLLAGLNKIAPTTVIEPVPCRDHTERMLRAFGADIAVERNSDGGNVITLRGGKRLKARPVAVPADISSAAFPIVAALIGEDRDILIQNVGLNPLRTGLLTVLKEMGADISYENAREIAGEPVADVRARSSRLRGVDVPAEIAPSMIDEYPILAVAAAFADGDTVLNGLSELKVKESNRFEAIKTGLIGNGVDCVESGGNSLKIRGKGKNPCGGGRIEAKLDHRIAMSFLVMGTASEFPVVVDDVSSIATSFPNFISLMNTAGANIHDYRD